MGEVVKHRFVMLFAQLTHDCALVRRWSGQRNKFDICYLAIWSSIGLVKLPDHIHPGFKSPPSWRSAVQVFLFAPEAFSWHNMISRLTEYDKIFDANINKRFPDFNA